MAQTNKKKNVGVIGLGIIGTRVAAGLRHAGFNTSVWNRTPKPAPNFLGSPAEVAQECEIIQLFVADARAVMETIEALASVLTPQHLIICNGTIGLEGTLAAAERVRQLGARFLDAPFTGSKGAADKRQLDTTSVVRSRISCGQSRSSRRRARRSSRSAASARRRW